jgi:outer membrane protein assembly factor BamD
MKKTIYFLIIIFTGWGCSGSIDTTNLSPEDHYKYAFELFTDEDYQESLKEFQSILIQYPGSAINDDAQYYLGFTYFKRGEYLLSAYEFSKLIRDIPASTFVPDAQYMLAESYYQLSPNFQLDQSYSKKAIQEFQAFLDFFPANPRVEEAEAKIQEMNYKLARKEYNNALIYERMQFSIAAINYYQSVTETYHDTEFAPMALYRKIKLLISKDRITEAKKDIGTYLSKYPNTPEIDELKQLREEYSKNING